MLTAPPAMIIHQYTGEPVLPDIDAASGQYVTAADYALGQAPATARPMTADERRSYLLAWLPGARADRRH